MFWGGNQFIVEEEKKNNENRVTTEKERKLTQRGSLNNASNNPLANPTEAIQMNIERKILSNSPEN